MTKGNEGSYDWTAGNDDKTKSNSDRVISPGGSLDFLSDIVSLSGKGQK